MSADTVQLPDIEVLGDAMRMTHAAARKLRQAHGRMEGGYALTDRGQTQIQQLINEALALLDAAMARLR